MRVLHIVIPGPPRDASKNRARKVASVNGRGVTYPTAALKSFRDRAMEAFLRQDDGSIDPRFPVSIKLVTYWPRWSKKYNCPMGDVDATVTQVMDAMKRSGMVEDDITVGPALLDRGYDRENPRIELTIMQEEPEP